MILQTGQWSGKKRKRARGKRADAACYRGRSCRRNRRWPRNPQAWQDRANIQRLRTAGLL